MKHHRSLVASSHRLSKNCCAIGTPHAHANTPSSSIPAQKASQVSRSKLPQTEQEFLRNRYASRACKHPIKQDSGTESIAGQKHCNTESIAAQKALRDRKHCNTESIAAQKALRDRKHCGTESIATQKALRHRKHSSTESIAGLLQQRHLSHMYKSCCTPGPHHALAHRHMHAGLHHALARRHTHAEPHHALAHRHMHAGLHHALARSHMHAGLHGALAHKHTHAGPHDALARRHMHPGMSSRSRPPPCTQQRSQGRRSIHARPAQESVSAGARMLDPGHLPTCCCRDGGLCGRPEGCL